MRLRMGSKQTEEVVYLPHTALRMHPRNMRRVYPRREVERMAASIKARGVIEPLVGVRVDGHVQVVCGNLRLTAARHLGDEAPLLPVIVRERQEIEQLLDMTAENLVRAAPDPISEALHYRRVLQEPGMTRTRLARETGVAVATINDRLRLLDLEPEIQDLIAAGRLPRGRPAVEALLSIPDPRARVETAQALAKRRADVRLIKATCTRVRGALEHRLSIRQAAREGKEYVPALEGVLEEGLPPGEGRPIPWDVLQKAARGSCGGCELKAEQLPGVPEPAWAVFQERERPGEAPDPVWGEVARAAEGTCAACGVRDVQEICGACPLIEFLRRVVREIDRR